MPKNMKASIHVENTLALPQGEDEEGQMIKYQVRAAQGGTMANFI